MQPEISVKCPRCGKEHTLTLNPSILEEASKGGLAQIAIPCGDHVLLTYVDRYGMVRRASTTLLVTGPGPALKAGTISFNWSERKLADEKIVMDVLGEDYLRSIREVLEGKAKPTPELESLLAKLVVLGIITDKVTR
ncbi:MAG: hypothetical protein RXO22_00550 [Thermocladium sp.]